MKPSEVWRTTLGELQVHLTRATYDTWLRHSQAVSFDDDCLVVAVPNDYTREWLERRLDSTIRRTVERVLGHPVNCSYVVRQAAKIQPDTSPLFQANGTPPVNGGGAGEHPGSDEVEGADPFSTDRSDDPRPASGRTSRISASYAADSNLNTRYTFSSFVVGSGNRMAHAASVAVGENASVKYNPLFIYGGVGLGKTHLLHAVGHAAEARGGQVISVSSETFANDLISAIRGQSTDRFRDRYRAASVLLVDDIHFIAGKESTQEEFFHTFNALHGANGQIVMTSDRPPSAIATLEERLRSRFQWGLIVDIEPPDFETRVAILRSKADRRGLVVPDSVLELIANTVQHNVRELEGALNRVLAYCQCHQTHPSVEMARRALDDIMVRREPPPMDDVLGVVAEYFSISNEELCGRSRVARIAEPRQIAMFLMREESNGSYPQIGKYLGGRDHTTILHGCDKISRLMEQDAKLRRDVMQLRERLYAA